MTIKRDLKKLVRARQARTGERYTTALAKVQSERPGIDVLELLDLTEEGKALGLVGTIRMFSDLAERVNGQEALQRLSEILRATADDPATALFRAVMLEGQTAPPPPQRVIELLEEGRRFLVRARAGIGGVSESGRMMAFAVGDQTVVGLLWGTSSRPGFAVRPALVLRSPHSFMAERADAAVMLMSAGWRAP